MKKILEIGKIEAGIFIDRPNRFIGNIQIGNEIVQCHIHDSGRIKELLYPGNTVGIKKVDKIGKRKTNWDLIYGMTQDGEKILLNSAYHRYISEYILKDKKICPFGALDSLKTEVKNGDSRLDFLGVQDKKNIWIEVKGVSLVENNIAMFPDAPSERAQKHLVELMKLKEKGDRAAVLLLVFRSATKFRPRFETDIKFTKLFYEALQKGVEVYLMPLCLKDNAIYYDNKKIDIIDKKLLTI